MKKIILITLAIVLSLSFAVSAIALDDYNTYGGYQNATVNEAQKKKIKEIEEYWKEKINEITYDEVMFFKYEVGAEGGTQKLIEHYYKTGSLLSAGVSVTSPEVEKLPVYKSSAEKGIDIKKVAKNGSVFLYELWELKEIKIDLYNVIKNNEGILNYGDAQLDPLSPDLKFYVMIDHGNGDFLVISDGEYEVYYCCRWIGDPIGHENQLYSPRQVLATMLKDSDWTENEEYYDYTKEAPSTGGSEVVGIAVLCAGASLLGAVTGAVLSRKKGSSK